MPSASDAIGLWCPGGYAAIATGLVDLLVFWSPYLPAPSSLVHVDLQLLTIIRGRTLHLEALLKHEVRCSVWTKLSLEAFSWFKIFILYLLNKTLF